MVVVFGFFMASCTLLSFHEGRITREDVRLFVDTSEAYIDTRDYGSYVDRFSGEFRLIDEDGNVSGRQKTMDALKVMFLYAVLHDIEISIESIDLAWNGQSAVVRTRSERYSVYQDGYQRWAERDYFTEKIHLVLEGGELKIREIRTLETTAEPLSELSAP